MSKYVINDTTLTSIADAVREKAGTSEAIVVSDLPQAILDIPQEGGGGGDIDPALLTFSGNLNYLFYNSNWDAFVNEYGNKITTENVTSIVAATWGKTIEDFSWFTVNLNSSANSLSFSNCTQIKELPCLDYSNNTVVYGFVWSSLLANCQSLRYIRPDFIVLPSTQSNFDFSSTSNQSGRFSNCYSLREIPGYLFYDNSNSPTSSYANPATRGVCNNCYSLDEIRDMFIKYKQSGTISFNLFSSTSFKNCNRLKELTFGLQDDGTVYTVGVTNITLDLSSYVGYASSSANILNYNSGITADKEVTDAASYEALKNDPDWFTCDVAYSRYNHDSAVNTINSLPDTTAAIAVFSGDTNTIKFLGESGSATDGGAINTLTAEEIAVATAKGWTVTLV